MTKKYPNIQVSKGMAGWFAVKMWWNPEYGGFAESWDTGLGRYALQEQAIAEAKQWADSEGIPFYLPAELDDQPARQDVEQQMKELGFEIVRLKGDSKEKE